MVEEGCVWCCLYAGDVTDPDKDDMMPFTLDFFAQHHVLDNFNHREKLDNTLLLEGKIVEMDTPVFRYSCSACYQFSIAPMK